ncbi:hypothetical protein AB0I60_14240 [Actinosynnema sp. NPDC050436]|uniref:hypothetical protein n=1 Tax=Actinosynnema sp. NPDC050436 TaxID=3155659 RepID=UPI0033E799F9
MADQPEGTQPTHPLPAGHPTGPQTTTPQAAPPPAAPPQATDPQAAGPQATDPQAAPSQTDGPQAEAPQPSAAPQAAAPQAAPQAGHVPPRTPHPAPGGGFGRFARHKGTQLVVVGLIGLVLGGGLVALLDRDGRGPGDRPGLSRMDERHPDHRQGREFRDFPR